MPAGEKKQSTVNGNSLWHVCTVDRLSKQIKPVELDISHSGWLNPVSIPQLFDQHLALVNVLTLTQQKEAQTHLFILYMCLHLHFMSLCWCRCNKKEKKKCRLSMRWRPCAKPIPASRPCVTVLVSACLYSSVCWCEADVPQAVALLNVHTHIHILH